MGIRQSHPQEGRLNQPQNPIASSLSDVDEADVVLVHSSQAPTASSPSDVLDLQGLTPQGITVQGVQFAYGAHQVLRNVSLEVPRGTIMCLMGVNGCGKSTLIDCVLGEHVPDAGSIEVLGQLAAALDPPELARLVAYVPQVHERSFPYTVLHVVLMGRMAHVRGLASPDSTDEEIAREALATCGLADLAERDYTSLSGGEMQMVMLARSLAQQTPIILMDEPTAHLDFRNELLFLETIERLVQQQETTILMATHAPDQAFQLQRAGVPVTVALMRNGVVWQQGLPQDVLTAEALAEVFGVHGVVSEVLLPSGEALRRVIPLASEPMRAR